MRDRAGAAYLPILHSCGRQFATEVDPTDLSDGVQPATEDEVSRHSIPRPRLEQVLIISAASIVGTGLFVGVGLLLFWLFLPNRDRHVAQRAPTPTTASEQTVSPATASETLDAAMREAGREFTPSMTDQAAKSLAYAAASHDQKATQELEEQASKGVAPAEYGMGIYYELKAKGVGASVLDREHRRLRAVNRVVENSGCRYRADLRGE